MVCGCVTSPAHDEVTVKGKYLEDRFLIEEHIGEGGMANVWRARDVVSGKTVAVKLLKSNTADPAMRERFLREAETQAKLKSPRVAHLYHFGRDMKHGSLFTVMELVEGADLAQLFEHGKLPLSLTLEIVDQTLEGLAHAHQAGVIHRDIKPSNLKLSVVDGAFNLKLLDFVFVRLQNTDKHLTADGMVGGTLTYISPEELELAPLDHRLYLYSLGAVWFEMLAGRPPFVAKTPQLTAVRHLTEIPPRLETLVGLPIEVADLVAWMLEKSPADRPQSAQEIRYYIASIREKYALTAPAITPDPDIAEMWGVVPL